MVRPCSAKLEHQLRVCHHLPSPPFPAWWERLTFSLTIVTWSPLLLGDEVSFSGLPWVMRAKWVGSGMAISTPAAGWEAGPIVSAHWWELC